MGETFLLDTDLLAEVLRRRDEDQRVRTDLVDEAEWAGVDTDNTAFLKRVIAACGHWPGRALLGTEGEQAMWLFAQHADRDPAFQARALDLLTEAAARGDADPCHVAYLTDRCRVAADRPQLYGTRCRVRFDGAVEPGPIEDLDRLDERRRRVGLGPHADYLRQMREINAPA